MWLQKKKREWLDNVTKRQCIALKIEVGKLFLHTNVLLLEFTGQVALRNDEISTRSF
jgi:hypothetical protein